MYFWLAKFIYIQKNSSVTLCVTQKKVGATKPMIPRCWEEGSRPFLSARFYQLEITICFLIMTKIV